MRRPTDIDRLHEEIQELIDELWQVPRFAGGRRGFRPQVDCYRSETRRRSRRRRAARASTPSDQGGRGRPRPGRRRREAAAARRERPLPADGDRVRPLPAPDPARRAGRHRARRRARYEHGLLTVVLPIATKAPAAERVLITIAGPRMSELNFDEPFEPTNVEIPSTLPVLPLKETVVFPQSVSPLAIGQERSIQLVDDVVAGERDAGARHRRRTPRPSSPAGTTSTRSAPRRSCTR